MTTERERQIVDLAQDQGLFWDNPLDEDIVVSEGEDNGAWVRAWVWVSFADTPLDKEVEPEEDDEASELRPDPTNSNATLEGDDGHVRSNETTTQEGTAGARPGAVPAGTADEDAR